jgi:hypothetical protein
VNQIGWKVQLETHKGEDFIVNLEWLLDREVIGQTHKRQLIGKT